MRLGIDIADNARCSRAMGHQSADAARSFAMAEALVKCLNSSILLHDVAGLPAAATLESLSGAWRRRADQLGVGSLAASTSRSMAFTTAVAIALGGGDGDD